MNRKEEKFSILSLFLVLSLLVVFGNVYAQTNGIITGKVTDATSGDFLPGANVMLKGTTIGAATDREGNYRIPNVPPGSYVLVVNYIGYEEFSTDIKITVGSRTKQDVALKVSYVTTKEVVVSGLREGQIKALSQQRTAVNIKNVVAREQMERFPDYNTAEVVQRLPGVYISRDQGEGRYIMVRGTEPRLSTVTVNGEKLATSRGEERYISTDIVGSNQMASIEVVKAITPDMEGDAIGGTVNLVTRSAFDYEGRRVALSAGSGYGALVDRPFYIGKASYSNRFGVNRNIGVTFTANWDRSDKGADNNEFDWGAEEDVNGNVIPFALQQMDLRDYFVKRDRYGLGGSFEYRPSDNHRFYVLGMWNKYNDDEDRGRWRIRVSKGDYLNPQGTLTQKSRFVREHKARIERNLTTQFSAGGVHQFSNLALDYTIAYSYAEEKKRPQIESEWDFDKKVNLALDLSDTDNPKWTVTNMDNDLQYDPSHYVLGGLDVRDTFTSDNDLVGAVNFKLPFSLGGRSSELKFGGKVRSKEKDRNDDRFRYKWKGDEDVTMAGLTTGKEDMDFLNGNYRYGPTPDSDKMRDFFNQHKDKELQGDLDYWDSEGQSYNAKEKVYAYYAMTTINFGNVMFLGGFRHELTNNDYEGTKLLFDESGDFSSMEPIDQNESQSHFLPMVHLRYRFDPMTNLRAAFTRTLARANYFDLVPYFFVDPDAEEIRAGNSDLKSTTALNLDLMGEHYFQGIGIVSAGFFYKKLNDIIFIRTSRVRSGVWEGFDQEQPVNGGNAKLYGFELNWQQQLTFLPGFLNGFGIYANYTHTWANADLTGRTGFLPGQAGDVANFALSYEKGGFSSRFSVMYQDNFISEVGKDVDHDEYTDTHLQIDFSANQKLYRGLEVFLEVININNEPRRNYIGITSRPIQREFYSWWTRIGLRYAL